MSKSRKIRYAYYYGFESTDVDAVDDILDSVGDAGKAYQYTRDWNEHDEYFNEGKSQIEMIQEAANKAALEFEKSYQLGFEAGKKAALQWQPIETAPKDGTLILAYQKKKRDGKKLTWRNPPILIFWDVEEEIWLTVETDCVVKKMTHWAPLQPPAPEVSDVE